MKLLFEFFKQKINNFFMDSNTINCKIYYNYIQFVYLFCFLIRLLMETIHKNNISNKSLVNNQQHPFHLVKASP
jgi:hypothetical protein